MDEDKSGRIKLSQFYIRFENIAPTQQILDQSADRLIRFARGLALETFGSGFEVVIVVDEGSLTEKVSLWIGIASLGVSVLAADYSVALKNIEYLAEKSRVFYEMIEANERGNAPTPNHHRDQDHVAITRRTNTVLNRLKRLAKAAEEASRHPASQSRRAGLIEDVSGLIRRAPSDDERKEMLGYLSRHKTIQHALVADLGPDFEDEILRPRFAGDQAPTRGRAKGSSKAKSPKPKKLRPAVRRFTT